MGIRRREGGVAHQPIVIVTSSAVEKRGDVSGKRRPRLACSGEHAVAFRFGPALEHIREDRL